MRLTSSLINKNYPVLEEKQVKYLLELLTDKLGYDFNYYRELNISDRDIERLYDYWLSNKLNSVS